MQCSSNFPVIDDQLFGGLNYLTCLVYLDDVVIYLQMQEEHIKCLWAVLKCFRLHGLKLKPSKCEFFKENIEYLGHSVSSEGVWPSRANLKAITNTLNPPHTLPSRVLSGLWGITDASLRTSPGSWIPCMNMLAVKLPRKRKSEWS